MEEYFFDFSENPRRFCSGLFREEAVLGDDLGTFAWHLRECNTSLFSITVIDFEDVTLKPLYLPLQI